MNLAEQQLRDGLRELVESAELEISLSAVMRQGYRLKRGRRLRWSLVTVAACAAVGLIVAPLAGTAPIPAVPDPAATVTQDPSPAQATVTLPFEINDPSDLTYAAVTVTVTRTGSSATVEVTSETTGGQPVSGSYRAEADRYQEFLVAPGLMVVLVPGQVGQVIPLGGVDEPTDHEALQGLDLTAIAIQPQDPDAEFPGLIWRDTARVLRNSQDHIVPSADLTYTVTEQSGSSSTRRLVMFRDEGLDVWGFVDDYGDGRAAYPLQTEPDRAILGVSATSSAAGDYFYESVAIGFLPEGGTDPQLTLSTPNARWVAGELGQTGRIAVLAVADQIPAGQALVTTVTFIDTTGTTVSYTPSVATLPPPWEIEDETEPPSPECEPADLSRLMLRQSQEGPATVAYGSKIVDAVEVDAGEGYRIVAVRLDKPTGPGKSDKAAWIRPAEGGWSLVVSDEWDGGGMPGGTVLPQGPDARAAALDCLD